MSKGISHITFIVRDLEKSVRMIIELFGAHQVYSSGDEFHSRSREVFLQVNNIWIALMQGDPLKEKTYNHIAFTVSEDDLVAIEKKINSLGLEVLPDRSRKTGEGRSLYFYDYDNHLFELHTGNLDERLQAYTAVK